MRFYFITVLTDDQERSLEFYRDRLGFSVVQDRTHENGLRWLVLSPGGPEGPQISLVKADTENRAKAVGKQVPGGVLMAFHTEDLRPDYDRLKGRSVRFVKEPEEVPWGIEARFLDDCGNVLEMIQLSEG